MKISKILVMSVAALALSNAAFAGMGKNPHVQDSAITQQHGKGEQAADQGKTGKTPQASEQQQQAPQKETQSQSQAQQQESQQQAQQQLKQEFQQK